jgi:hypothetical protein
MFTYAPSRMLSWLQVREVWRWVMKDPKELGWLLANISCEPIFWYA